MKVRETRERKKKAKIPECCARVLKSFGRFRRTKIKPCKLLPVMAERKEQRPVRILLGCLLDNIVKVETHRHCCNVWPLKRRERWERWER